MMYVQNAIIPPDVELVIPGNIGFFEFLIVIGFLAHILFVNITIGSSAMAVYQEIKAMRTKNHVHDLLAYQLANHTSVLKSIAVVLGVAPLLIISVIYTQFFYPSTILIGKAWLSLIIILITAFLILYVYKFKWEDMSKHPKTKKWHVTIGFLGSLLLFFVPLIFIVNVVSMLYPTMWEGANGFFHSLFYYPQIWPRYGHFVLASLAISGFYLYFWNNRLEKKAENVTESELDMMKLGKRLGLRVMIGTTVLQFVFGFLLLFSFEKRIRLLYMGEDALLTSLFVISLLATLVLIYFLYLLMTKEKQTYFMYAMTTFVLILGLMGWMRHELRESYIKPYKEETPQTTVQTDER